MILRRGVRSLRKKIEAGGNSRGAEKGDVNVVPPLAVSSCFYSLLFCSLLQQGSAFGAPICCNRQRCLRHWPPREWKDRVASARRGSGSPSGELPIRCKLDLAMARSLSLIAHGHAATLLAQAPFSKPWAAKHRHRPKSFLSRASSSRCFPRRARTARSPRWPRRRTRRSRSRGQATPATRAQEKELHAKEEGHMCSSSPM